jgi:hypothetical protein
MASAMSEVEPPILPPLPPRSRISVLISKLQATSAAAFARVVSFNSWIAAKFHTTRERIFQVEMGGLLAFGATLMEIGEWAGAIACWVLLGFMLFARALAWEGGRGARGLTAFLRICYAAGAIALCVLLIAITTLRKPEIEPWSNLLKLWSRPLVTISPPSVPFPVRGTTQHFRIENKSDQHSYSNLFLLRVRPPTFSATDFAFDVPQSSLKVLKSSPYTDLEFGDIAAMSGRDSEGTPFILIACYHLEPHEVRDVTLTMVEPNDSAPTSGALPEKMASLNPINAEATGKLLSNTTNATPIKFLQGIISYDVEMPRGTQLTVDHAIVCFKNDNAAESACIANPIRQGAVALPYGIYAIKIVGKRVHK